MAYEKRGVLGQIGGVVGLVCAIFLLVGLIFCGVAFFSYQSAAEFRRDGVNVMGTVEKRWESTRSCKDSNDNMTRTCTDFNVGFAYEVEGKVLHASSTTDYSTYAGLEEGMLIMVRYLPRDPSRNVTSFDPEHVDPAGALGVLALVFGGLGGLFSLGSGGALVWLIGRARARVRLRDAGTARGAVVLAQEPTNVTVNKRPMWRITWKDDAGTLGHSMGRAREDLPAVGARITVYVDPEGKLGAAWEGDTGSR